MPYIRKVTWELLRWEMKVSQLKQFAKKFHIDISQYRDNQKKQIAKKIASHIGIKIEQGGK